MATGHCCICILLAFFVTLSGCASKNIIYNDYSMVDSYTKNKPLRNISYYKDDNSNMVVKSEINSNNENVLRYLKQFSETNEGFCSLYKGKWYYDDNSPYQLSSIGVNMYEQARIAFHYLSRYKCISENGDNIFYGNGSFQDKAKIFGHDVYTLKFYSVVPFGSIAYENVDHIRIETPYSINWKN